jgi:hypothetical protein
LNPHNRDDEQPSERGDDDLFYLSFQEERGVYPSHEASHHGFSVVIDGVRVHVVQPDRGA